MRRLPEDAGGDEGAVPFEFSEFVLPAVEQIVVAADIVVGQGLVAEQFRVQHADPDAAARLRVVVRDVSGLGEVGPVAGLGAPSPPPPTCGYPSTRDGR